VFHQIEDLRIEFLKRQEEARKSPTNLHLQMEVQTFQNFLLFLDEEFSPLKEKVGLLKGEITFELLWYLFPIGCEVIFKDPDTDLDCAGKVRSPFFSLFPYHR
jgi:hypothetical protein